MAEGLRHDAHGFDFWRLFLTRAIGLDDGQRMTILQQGRQRFAMLAKEADRQTSDQPDRLAAVGEWRQCGERQRLGVFGEKLSVITRASASTRLSFRQLADALRFAERQAALQGERVS